MPPGNVDLKVYVCPHGYANIKNGIVKLRITSVSKSFSSLGGGQELVINGFGFMTSMKYPDTIDVKVGDIPCEVSKVEATKINCKTGAHNNRVEIRITANGFKYASDNSPADEIVIEKGQEILFTWMISIPGTVPIIDLQKVSKGPVFKKNLSFLLISF